MLRAILKLMPVLALTCVLVVASWKPNNFGLSPGVSATALLWSDCVELLRSHRTDAVVIELPPWLREAASPIATVVALFIALRLLLSLNEQLTYGRTRGAVTGFVGQQRVFYVRRGPAAPRSRNKL